MKWLIGVDLQDKAAGALQFAGWLRDHAVSGTTLSFLPVHALEEPYLLQALRHTHLSDVEQKSAADAQVQLEHAGFGPATSTTVARGVAADEVLVRQFDAAGADVLLIGRQAPKDERTFVRLGRVARRLVRRLPCPLVVVPPDLRSEQIGRGPIILATDLEETCGSAASFARRVAHQVGRPLVVAHVVSDAVETARYLPSATVDQFLSQVGLERDRDLRVWLRGHKLEDAAAVVAHGDVVARLSSIAEAEHAPLIVVGSRGLGTIERLFATSVGTDLSCWAGCAVAMVPPTWAI